MLQSAASSKQVHLTNKNINRRGSYGTFRSDKSIMHIRTKYVDATRVFFPTDLSIANVAEEERPAFLNQTSPSFRPVCISFIRTLVI